MADKLYWIDANGVETALNSQNIKLLEGMIGRHMPSMSFEEEEVPFQSGSRLRSVKAQARDIDIPLLLETSSEITLRQMMRQILRSFNPLRGDGKLRAVAVDGSSRELVCRYRSGLEGQEGKDVKGNCWQKLVLVFRAFDPYWYDSSTIVHTFTTGQTATFFPFFPLRLSSSSVFADAKIDNTGDVEAYPEWIVNGAGENIVIRNMTTGEVTELSVALGTGESIIINTQKKTITKNDGTNLYYTLSDASSLWSLQSGMNNIRIEMSNATEASSVQLSYKNRYLGV